MHSVLEMANWSMKEEFMCSNISVFSMLWLAPTENSAPFHKPDRSSGELCFRTLWISKKKMVKGGKNKGKSNIKPNLSNKSAKAFVGLVGFLF